MAPQPVENTQTGRYVEHVPAGLAHQEHVVARRGTAKQPSDAIRGLSAVSELPQLQVL